MAFCRSFRNIRISIVEQEEIVMLFLEFEGFGNGLSEDEGR